MEKKLIKTKSKNVLLLKSMISFTVKKNRYGFSLSAEVQN